MNGDGDDITEERRIWRFCHYGDYDCIAICLVEDEDIDFDFDEARRTVSEVRDLIERHVENGANDAIVSRLVFFRDGTGTHLTEEECTLLGQSCQPLVHHLRELVIRIVWTDLDASCILRHMSLSSSTINMIGLYGHNAEMPMTIRTLRDESPASLCLMRLHHVVFTSDDCQILGQMISNKERALDCVVLMYCFFPCLADFLTLIAGFVKDKIPSDDCRFCGCSVKDASIPKHDGADYLEFGRIFGEFWQRRDGEPEEPETNTDEQKATRLEKSADDMFHYFRPLQRAGLSRLLPPPPPPPRQNTDGAPVVETRQPHERREWVRVLGHEAVKERVDALFHILLLNPEVCKLEQECSAVASRLKTAAADCGNGDELHETKLPIGKR